ncbi:hypothetical protein BDF14DRAFT_1865770 [Spinellus fusiger]|nr:hypothetical protein BDF14DRAFT_1865770 [Spinellus fusiger]
MPPIPKRNKLKASLAKVLADAKANEIKKHKETTREELYKRTKQNVNGKSLQKRQKPTYTSKDRILLIGEGNFSFARALSEKYLTEGSERLVATCFDSEKTLYEKYGEEVKDNIAYITALGAKVFYDVDGTQLEKCKGIKNDLYSKIVFNFPHAGSGIKDQDRNVRSNQELLSAFFASASQRLSDGKRLFYQESIKEEEEEEKEKEVAAYEEEPLPNGEIHVTIKTCKPYHLWAIRNLAKTGQLATKTTYAFHPDDYPGYEHRRTLGFKAGVSKTENAEILKAVPKTFVFVHKKVMEGEVAKSVQGKITKKVQAGKKGASKRKRVEEKEEEEDLD